MYDRWPWLFQTSIPRPLDYPIRSPGQAWYVSSISRDDAYLHLSSSIPASLPFLPSSFSRNNILVDMLLLFPPHLLSRSNAAFTSQGLRQWPDRFVLRRQLAVKYHSLATPAERHMMTARSCPRRARATLRSAMLYFRCCVLSATYYYPLTVTDQTSLSCSIPRIVDRGFLQRGCAAPGAHRRCAQACAAFEAFEKVAPHCGVNLMIQQNASVPCPALSRRTFPHKRPFLSAGHTHMDHTHA